MLIGKAILIEKTLIFGDLHIGMELSMSKKGTLIPHTQFKKLFNEIKYLIKKTNPERVIINGDVKHDFGTISNQEWRELIKIFDLLKDKELILIKGNHDKVTEIIAKKRNVSVKNYFVIGEHYICHGDVIHENEYIKNAKTIIIGHEHPAIALQDGVKCEKYKCFLKTTWKGKKLWVLPSFTPLVEGSDVLKEKLFSPFLKNIKKVEVFITHDMKVLNFGNINLI